MQFSIQRPTLPSAETHPEEKLYRRLDVTTWLRHLNHTGQVEEEYKLRKVCLWVCVAYTCVFVTMLQDQLEKCYKSTFTWASRAASVLLIQSNFTFSCIVFSARLTHTQSHSESNVPAVCLTFGFNQQPHFINNDRVGHGRSPSESFHFSGIDSVEASASS